MARANVTKKTTWASERATQIPPDPLPDDPEPSPRELRRLGWSFVWLFVIGFTTVLTADGAELVDAEVWASAATGGIFAALGALRDFARDKLDGVD